MSIAQTLIERVREIRRDCPADMIEHEVAAILGHIAHAPIEGTVPVRDVAWLLAQAVAEVSKPKVYERIMSDGITVGDRLG